MPPTFGTVPPRRPGNKRWNMESLQQPDDEARQLAGHNLDVVEKCLKKFFHECCRDDATEQDLIQEGRIKLYKIAKTYNRARNTPFKSYAYRCLRNYFQTRLRKLSTWQYKWGVTGAEDHDFDVEETAVTYHGISCIRFTFGETYDPAFAGEVGAIHYRQTKWPACIYWVPVAKIPGCGLSAFVRRIELTLREHAENRASMMTYLDKARALLSPAELAVFTAMAEAGERPGTHGALARVAARMGKDAGDIQRTWNRLIIRLKKENQKKTA